MTALLPGFADPVAESQACFRAVLDALARPGTLHRAGAKLTPPTPLGRAAAAVLLTLIDADTPLWLDPDAAAARPWLAFHAGAPFAAAPGAAAFVHALALPDFPSLRQGSDIAPEDGATVVLEVAALGIGAELALTGPGLERPDTLRVGGLPAAFATIWAANRALYPRGVDLILTCGTTLAALPRSVAVG
jgi:alpha-D-ribose 1-methylphosphonate 5-triphosphate synthase subunit PhnH